jgi:hypothetical protein
LLKILTAPLAVSGFLRVDRNGPVGEDEMNQAEMLRVSPGFT